MNQSFYLPSIGTRPTPLRSNLSVGNEPKCVHSDEAYSDNVSTDQNTDAEKLIPTTRIGETDELVSSESIYELAVNEFKTLRISFYKDAGGDLIGRMSSKELRNNSTTPLRDCALVDRNFLELSTSTSSIVCFNYQDKSGALICTVFDKTKNKALFTFGLSNTSILNDLMTAEEKQKVIAVDRGLVSRSLNLAIATAYLVFSRIAAKTKQTSSARAVRGLVANPGSESHGLQTSKKGGNKLQDTAAPFCIDHDLTCTGALGVNSPHAFTFGYLGIPVYVNFLECCIQHDIDLWCGAENEDTVVRDYDTINAKLGTCILRKFREAARDQLGKYIFYVLGGWAAALANGILVGGAYTLAAQVGGYGNIAEELFPLDRRHKDSCLCGGTGDTFWCRDICRDMCKERGKRANCFDCHWQCRYDKKGKAIGADWITSTELPCCVATDFHHCQRLVGEEKDAVAKCLESYCSKCFWACDYSNPDKPIKIQINPDNTRPCCKGTPGPRPKAPCIV